MGSGGLIVLDESTCMVDLAKYFLNFTQIESCGKCTFCRIGTKRMLEILERITKETAGRLIWICWRCMLSRKAGKFCADSVRPLQIRSYNHKIFQGRI